MEIRIQRGGMQTTVQDLGRSGFRAIGVPLNGAMDPLALRVANALVGNSEKHAGLEFTLVGPELEFSGDALIAVGGAECEGVENWRPFEVRAGTRLNFGPCIRGCRGYIAFRGGIETEPLLGSRSTYLRGGWGGLNGRALRDGDRVRVGATDAVAHLVPTRTAWRIDPRILPAYSSAPSIRAIRAADSGEWCDRLFNVEFKVTTNSDRMGLRLSGDAVVAPNSGNQLSSAVGPGTVQIPPDGQPLVLMADAQTIGGYPQAAHVICVDRPLVAQLRPGDSLRFREVSLEEAHQLALTRDHALAMLREGLVQKLDESIDVAPT